MGDVNMNVPDMSWSAREVECYVSKALGLCKYNIKESKDTLIEHLKPIFGNGDICKKIVDVDKNELNISFAKKFGKKDLTLLKKSLVSIDSRFETMKCFTTAEDIATYVIENIDSYSQEPTKRDEVKASLEHVFGANAELWKKIIHTNKFRTAFADKLGVGRMRILKEFLVDKEPIVDPISKNRYVELKWELHLT